MNMRAKLPAGDERAVVDEAIAPTAEAPAKDKIAALAPPAPERNAAPETAKKKRGNGRRTFLLVSVPLLLAVGGGYFWLTGGRYVATDNAYVQQTNVSISADVDGRIVEVMVKENQTVKPGDVLFKIDPEPYRIALDSANASLAQARLSVEQLRAAYRTAVAKLDAARSTADVRQRELQRANDLVKKGFSTPAAQDEASLAAQQAANDVALARQEVDSATAALAGRPDIPTDQHPTVLAALAAKEKAELDLAHTTIKAPEAGIVSQVDKLSPGQYVSAGTAMLSIVENGDTWIEANFKETQLTNMRPGQKTEVSVDAYPDLKLEGTVGSIGAATGAEFSVIPAQNATGNWVKVVQRIPVRIRVTGESASALRSGMSTEISVDTGKSRISEMF